MVVLEHLLGRAGWWDFYREKSRLDTDLWQLRDASVLFVRVVAAPGTELAAIDQRLLDKMTETAEEVVREPRRLANARSALLLAHATALEDLDERGERIARHMHDRGEPDLTQEEMRAIQDVTAEGLVAFVARLRETYVVVHVAPEAGAPRAGEVVP
jgi:predicted Zn-dependent peptidase